MFKVLLALLALSLSPAFAAERVIMHTDRPTPKLIFQPNGGTEKSGDAAKTAAAYVETAWERLGLQPHATNLVEGRTQHSLLGSHFHFEQRYQGLPVEGGEVIVSVSYDTGQIVRVFNNTFPEPTTKRARQAEFELDADEALDLAWEHLKVHGPLTAPLAAEEAWAVVDGQFHLIWRTHLVLEAPFGNWTVAVDAVNGAIVEAKDMSIDRRERDQVDFAAYTGELADRREEMDRLARSEKAAVAGKRATGSGTVFDPDPRTTLLNEDLADNSPASAFAGSYLTRTLEDITNTNGTFTLEGPWCRISNFETPNTAPSTSADGTWNHERGVNAFNDAMTYFQLDQSQRYIQSLGFTGDKGIQNLSIETDSDGFQGQDNSHYLSSFNSLGVNRLAFGHGCVDDNEDADVILHEYGHALQKFINLNWNGGDTGAMGEGFGDYWGTSYSYTTENGPAYHPEWIFSWDGHNDCWGGRTLDATEIQYNPNNTYGAHQSVGGGRQSDELWGTPLLQSLLQLDGMGYPTSDADQIVLESHFGLGSGLRMPELAQATVDAAAALFPGLPHAQIFHDNFAVNGIDTVVTGAPASFTYISAHVPPDNDWINTIEIANPGNNSANITATVYELVNGSYIAAHTEEILLGGNGSTTYSPDGSAQRWVRFVSDQPLVGTSFFARTVTGRGEEKAGIPLFREDEVGTSVILPHIPGDRSFFSGAVILNPNDEAITLTYQLYDANGVAENGLLTSAARQSLAAYEKWVGFLAPFPGATSLFDDETGSVNKVSYVKITSNHPIAAFELFGYKATADSPLATSGIKALPDSTTTVYPIRATLTDAYFTSFSVLNPNTSIANLSVEVVNRVGVTVGTTSVSIPGRTKVLGLNINDPADPNLQFFRVPYPLANIDLSTPNDIAAVILKGAQNLRVFELTGRGTSELDGCAVMPLATKTAFANPRGVLEIFKTGAAGNVIVRTVTNGTPEFQTISMDTYDFRQITLGTPDLVVVEGSDIAATVITRDAANGSLTVVKGTQVEAESE